MWKTEGDWIGEFVCFPTQRQDGEPADLLIALRQIAEAHGGVRATVLLLMKPLSLSGVQSRVIMLHDLLHLGIGQQLVDDGGFEIGFLGEGAHG